MDEAVASQRFDDPDHLNQSEYLNTPRLVADASGTTVWRWDQGEPFANNPADENPSGLGAFDLPLRLPGQRYDAETGLHYNYFRDYDSSLGRYGESDPIGLRGGLNTYTYVAGQPLRATDNFGLVKWTGSMTAISVVAGGGATRLSFDLTSECVMGKRGRVKVLAGGFALGLGARFTGTGSSVEFEDDLSNVDPFVFEGQAKYVSIGLVLGANPDPPAPNPWPTITVGCSALQLGGATSIGCTFDPKGFDASVSGGVGISNVRDAKIECCTQ